MNACIGKIDMSNRSAAPMASMAFRRRFRQGQVQSQFGSHKSSTEYLALRGASSGATEGAGASRTVGSSLGGAAGSVGARRPLPALLGLGTTLLALLGASGRFLTTLGNEGCRRSLPMVSLASGSSSSSSKLAHLA